MDFDQTFREFLLLCYLSVLNVYLNLKLWCRIFSTFLNRFGLRIFLVMRRLSYNSETMRWILLEHSKNYYYVAYKLSTFNLTSNFTFSTLNNFELRLFLLLCFLLEWWFLTFRRTCLHTRAYVLTHAHTYVYIHMNTRISRYLNPLTLKRTHTWMHSHLDALTLGCTHTWTHSHLHALTLARTHTRTHLHSHALTLARTHTRTHSHSHLRAHTHTHIHLHTGAVASTLMHVHAHIRAYSKLHTCPHNLACIPIHTHARARSHAHTRICTIKKYFHCYMHYACETLRELFLLS